METEPNIFVNPLPSAMKNGVSLGVIFSLNFILTPSSNAVVQVLTYVILVFIMLSTWRYTCMFRDNESGGSISFYRAFSYIFLLFFFASLISAAVKLVYLKYINTNYLSDLFAATEKVIQQLQIQMPEGYNAALSDMLSPIKFTMQTLMVDTMLGAILGLLYAPFIKREKKNS